MYLNTSKTAGPFSMLLSRKIMHNKDKFNEQQIPQIQPSKLAVGYDVKAHGRKANTKWPRTFLTNYKEREGSANSKGLELVSAIVREEN